MYVQSQNRYMQPVVSHTITKDRRTASGLVMFFVSLPNIAGATTEAITPRIAKTMVPEIIPGAANPYDSTAIEELGET